MFSEEQYLLTDKIIAYLHKSHLFDGPLQLTRNIQQVPIKTLLVRRKYTYKTGCENNLTFLGFDPP